MVFAGPGLDKVSVSTGRGREQTETAARWLWGRRGQGLGTAKEGKIEKCKAFDPSHFLAVIVIVVVVART